MAASSEGNAETENGEAGGVASAANGRTAKNSGWRREKRNEKYMKMKIINVMAKYVMAASISQPLLGSALQPEKRTVISGETHVSGVSLSRSWQKPSAKRWPPALAEAALALCGFSSILLASSALAGS